MLVFKSTHEPEQFVSPVLQPLPHTPAEHTGVEPEQTVPHPPQLFLSLDVSVQTPPHAVPVPGHLHAPDMQCWPPVHATHVAPQCVSSVEVLAHVPSGQSTCGAMHDVLHAEPVQTCPVGHTWPHVPQLSLSVAVSVQVEPHKVVEPVQMQLPPLHDVPPVHGLPQPPQFFGSLSMSTHDPLQLILVPEHVAPHADDSHTSPEAHALLQSPQWAGSFVRSTHALPHIVRPGPHLQTPPMHVDPPSHAVPHFPQFAGSLAGSMQWPPQTR